MNKTKHEIFLEKLYKSNEEYRNGKFKVLGKYKGTKIKIIVEDYFGKCLMSPNGLLKGYSTSLKSSINKTKYFKNMLFKNNTYFRQKHFTILGNYEQSKIKILIKNSYGECLVKPDSLLKGSLPTILSAIDKTEYFINQAIEVHGNLFNYNLVNYKNNTTKVIIGCKIHNKNFEQTPQYHLLGRGCPKCNSILIGDQPTGWTKTNWKKAGLNSKNFDSFKVYIIKCWDRYGEVFYKIGRTFNTIKQRFYSKNIPYKYSILKIFTGTAEEMFDLENRLQRENKKWSYTPKQCFGGATECFSKIN